MENKFIDKCPHCGSTNGLFAKEYVSYLQYYTYFGEADGYGDFSHTDRRISTPLYCVDCERKITTLEKLRGSEG